MSLWKLAASYFIPTLIIVSLLCGHFLGQLGLLERWFLGDAEIHQIVSAPPAPPVFAPAPALNQMRAAMVTWPGLASDRGYKREIDDGKEKQGTAPYTYAYQDSTKKTLRTARAYFNQALAYKRLGRLDEAIGSYVRALVYNHNFPPTLLNMGALHYRRGMATSTRGLRSRNAPGQQLSQGAPQSRPDL